jgi:hypothetical protein
MLGKIAVLERCGPDLNPIGQIDSRNAHSSCPICLDTQHLDIAVVARGRTNVVDFPHSLFGESLLSGEVI